MTLPVYRTDTRLKVAARLVAVLRHRRMRVQAYEYHRGNRVRRRPVTIGVSELLQHEG